MGVQGCVEMVQGSFSAPIFAPPPAAFPPPLYHTAASGPSSSDSSVSSSLEVEQQAEDLNFSFLCPTHSGLGVAVAAMGPQSEGGPYLWQSLAFWVEVLVWRRALAWRRAPVLKQEAEV